MHNSRGVRGEIAGVCGCVAVKTGTACVCELRDVIAYSTTASAVFTLVVARSAGWG